MSYLRFFVLAIVAVAVLVAETRAACTTNTDCSGITCPHGEHAVCKQVHGTGVGGGEYSCVCEKNNGRRSVRASTGCCTAADCDMAATGCDPNHQTVTCDIKSQHGHCQDNSCKCIQIHG